MPNTALATRPTIGRPSAYTPEIAETICTEIIEGKSLRTICARDDRPDATTVLRWLARFDDFRRRYALAGEARLTAWAERIVDIGDEVEGKTFTDDRGVTRIDPGAVQVARLQTDNLKWIMSKLAPQRFGDRIEHIVRPGAPAELTDDDLARIAQSTGAVMTHVLPSDAKPLIEHESVSSDGDEQGK